MSHHLARRGGLYHESLSQNPKFSHKDWSYNNQLKSRISCDQQKLADKVICEASRVIDETKETTSKFKKETDYRLEERVAHIAFTVEELREQKKFGEREQEILKVFHRSLFYESFLSSFHFHMTLFFWWIDFCSLFIFCRTQKTEFNVLSNRLKATLWSSVRSALYCVKIELESVCTISFFRCKLHQITP